MGAALEEITGCYRGVTQLMLRPPDPLGAPLGGPLGG